MLNRQVECQPAFDTHQRLTSPSFYAYSVSMKTTTCSGFAYRFTTACRHTWTAPQSFRFYDDTAGTAAGVSRSHVAGVRRRQ